MGQIAAASTTVQPVRVPPAVCAAMPNETGNSCSISITRAWQMLKVVAFHCQPNPGDACHGRLLLCCRSHYGIPAHTVGASIQSSPGFARKTFLISTCSTVTRYYTQHSMVWPGAPTHGKLLQQHSTLGWRVNCIHAESIPPTPNTGG